MTELHLDHPDTLPEHILKVLELYWGFGLPMEYRSFLLKHNGGEPVEDIFNFKDDKENGSDVRFFLGIYPDEHRNLLEYLKTYNGRIPKNLFPIAYDSCGNLICISTMGSDRGKIYFWDHEMEAYEVEEPDYSNLTLIADSFDEFLNSLHDLEDDKA